MNKKEIFIMNVMERASFSIDYLSAVYDYNTPGSKIALGDRYTKLKSLLENGFVTLLNNDTEGNIDTYLILKHYINLASTILWSAWEYDTGIVNDRRKKYTETKEYKGMNWRGIDKDYRKNQLSRYKELIKLYDSKEVFDLILHPFNNDKDLKEVKDFELNDTAYTASKTMIKISKRWGAAIIAIAGIYVDDVFDKDLIELSEEMSELLVALFNCPEIVTIGGDNIGNVADYITDRMEFNETSLINPDINRVIIHNLIKMISIDIAKCDTKGLFVLKNVINREEDFADEILCMHIAKFRSDGKLDTLFSDDVILNFMDNNFNLDMSDEDKIHIFRKYVSTATIPAREYNIRELLFTTEKLDPITQKFVDAIKDTDVHKLSFSGVINNEEDFKGFVN